MRGGTQKELRKRVAELEKTETQCEQEEAFQTSENKYKVLFENLPQKIFHKNKNSVYVSCNHNYAHDLKIKPVRLSEKQIMIFILKNSSR